MNNLLQAISTKISGSALYNDVAGRIYLDEYPTSEQPATYPYIIYFLVSDVPEYPGGKTIEEVMIQFSIFSASESAVEITGLLADLRTLFDDCSLTITSNTLIYFIRGNLTTIVDEITTVSGTSTVKHYSQEYDVIIVKD